jgi:hypothetical protein
MTNGEIYDKYRYLELWIESWIYDKSDPETHIEPWENKFPYPEDAPFSNNRKEWRNMTLKIIIARLTQIMIDRFEPRGITKPSGENDGTIDWSYKILSSFFDFTPGCAEADIILYKEIQKRLSGYKKQILKLETRRDELRRIKERTDIEIDELRDIIRRLEKLLKIESGDIDQLNRLKERCPGIEEYK